MEDFMDVAELLPAALKIMMSVLAYKTLPTMEEAQTVIAALEALKADRLALRNEVLEEADKAMCKRWHEIAPSFGNRSADLEKGVAEMLDAIRSLKHQRPTD